MDIMAVVFVFFIGFYVLVSRGKKKKEEADPVRKSMRKVIEKEKEIKRQKEKEKKNEKGRKEKRTNEPKLPYVDNSEEIRKIIQMQIEEGKNYKTNYKPHQISREEEERRQKELLKEAKSAGISKEEREQWFTSRSRIRTSADAKRFLSQPKSFFERKGTADTVNLDEYREANQKLMKKIESLLDEHDKNISLSFDTNILMKCSTLAKRLSENYPVVLSKKVYEELDRKKTDATFGSFARRGMKVIEHAQVQHGSCKFIYCQPDFLTQKGLNPDSPDEVIIGSLLRYQEEGNRVLLVTEDRGARILARDLGIACLPL